jgi:hypothetical protein
MIRKVKKRFVFFSGLRKEIKDILFPPLVFEFDETKPKSGLIYGVEG